MSRIEYPFLDLAGLKVGVTRDLPEKEVMEHRHGLIFLLENIAPIDIRKWFKTSDRYEVNKKTLTHQRLVDYEFANNFSMGTRYVASSKFENTLIHMIDAHYGLVHTAGGRRSAAMLASEFFNQRGIAPFVTYVASQQDRTLMKITGEEVTKYALVKLDSGNGEVKPEYLINSNIGILRVIYPRNEQSQPANLREFDPNKQWLNLRAEHIVPNRQNPDQRPIPFKIVYTKRTDST